MAYELNADDIFRFSDTVAGSKNQKGNELIFEYCPYCSGGKHGDKETFSINIRKGVFQCKRSSCGKQGHFVELCRDFGFPLDFQDVKQYKPLPQKQIETTDPAVLYLKSRGISEKIAKQYCITTQKEHPNILVFPFYDENGVLVSVKYRKCDFDKARDKNKEWFEKDTKPILFGVQQCTDFGRLVITEGQLDSLSLAECGIKNAVSVPNGANGFTWLVHMRDWISRFEKIVVFGDLERGKMSLLDTLVKRLDNQILAVNGKDYLGEKDTNAILCKYGKQAVIHAVENACVPKLNHVVDLSTVENIDIGQLPKIKTNIPELDRVIGGLLMGQLIVLTGKSGNGKSTLMSQLVAEALDQNENVFVYSGELAAYHFKRWLDYQLAGKDNLTAYINEYGETKYTIAPETVSRISSWYKGRAYIYDSSTADGAEQESILETAEKAVRQYGIRLVCIDNLMTAMAENTDQDFYRAQSQFAEALKNIAKKYNIAVILVAHQRKSKDSFGNEDVSGSADITNLADVVMNYEREKENGIYNARLSITKNRISGIYARGDNAIGLFFSQATKRISSGSSQQEKRYGWDVLAGFTNYYGDIPF
mgnify:CR=1 FL=1